MCNFAIQILVSFAYLVYIITGNEGCDNWGSVMDWNCATDAFSYTAENCYYNCDFNLGCKCKTFLPTNSSSLTISCNYLDACVDSNIYCPSDSIDSCTIYIDSEGSSLNGANIYVSSSYTYGYLNLLNKEARSQENYAGFALTTNCLDANGTIMSQTDITFDTWYKCSNTDCCPWHEPQCNVNKGCNISCSDTDCTKLYIDGSLSTDLDVMCEGKNDCINATVICPFNGSCSVTCLDYHSCWGMKIYYKEMNPMVPNGDYTIHPGAHVSIYCSADNSCEDMDILTPNVTSVTLMCNNKDNHYDHHEGICHNVTLNAANVDVLHILCLNDLACVDMHIDGKNAEEVVLYARSLDTAAWYKSTIIATNAIYTEIDCESDILFNSACSESKYYMPSTGFVLNCYGYGCYHFGDIYVDSDLSETQFNYDGCGYCQSVMNCTYDLQIYCNNKPVCNISTLDDDDLKYEQPIDNCGCDTLYIDAMKNFKNNETTCLDPFVIPISEVTKDKNRRSWIAILAGLGCGIFFIGIVAGLFWWRHKRNEQAINTVIGNVMLTQLNDVPEESQIEKGDNQETDNNNDNTTTTGGLDDDNIMEKCQM